MQMYTQAVCGPTYADVHTCAYVYTHIQMYTQAVCGPTSHWRQWMLLTLGKNAVL